MTDRIEAWLDESQRLTDQATEGPWEAYGSAIATLSEPWPGCTGCSGILSPAHLPDCYYREIAAAGEDDAEFIAEARTRFPQAVAALQAVMELHEPFWLYAHEDACENETEDHQQEHHVESDVGEYYCDTMPLYQVCSACLDGYGNHDVEYPCETRRLAEAALGLEGDNDE